MPHPKRKISKSRRDKRRTHHKIEAPGLGKCANCGEMKQNHMACKSCGYYNGRVILTDTAAT